MFLSLVNKDGGDFMIGGCLTGDFIIATGDFIIATGDFIFATGDFIFATGDFIIATGDFIIATGDFTISIFCVNGPDCSFLLSENYK